MKLRQLFRLPYVLIGLALVGPIFLLPRVMRSTALQPPAPIQVLPAAAPFKSYIAGSGAVESSSLNLNISPPVAGIISEMAVEPGKHVRKGELLFRLDGREVQAELLRRRAAVEVARATLAAAETADQFERVRDVTDTRVVSTEERNHRRLAAKAASKRVESASAEWRAAQENEKAQAITLSRLDVLAPIDSEVLQVNSHPGEFVAVGATAKAPVVLGNTDTLHVRVEIDENIAWRFVPGSRAKGFLRGNKELNADLKYVRVEPLLVGKVSLSGDFTERVDTRVLQVIYSFDQKHLHAYPGMLLDVFIESPEVSTASVRHESPQ